TQGPPHRGWDAGLALQRGRALGRGGPGGVPEGLREAERLTDPRRRSRFPGGLTLCGGRIRRRGASKQAARHAEWALIGPRRGPSRRRRCDVAFFGALTHASLMRPLHPEPHMLRYALISLLCLTFSSPVFAKELAGVKLADTIEVEGKTLQL